MICPNCKREVPDSAKACGYCGTWLAEDRDATDQVAEETAATITLPEEKGRSPWLWIGVGLVALIVVVAIGGLAFFALRDGEEVDTEATIAAAVAATAEAEATGAGAPETPTSAPAPTPAPTPTEAEPTPGDVPPAIVPGPLHLAGSTAVLPMAEALAGAYMELDPGRVVVVEGGDSSLGVTAVGEGHADIGTASRDVEPSEH